MPSGMMIQDGIIEWFNGPEWDQVAFGVMEDAASLVQVEAQANAIWEDRTGDARYGLSAEAFLDDASAGIQLFHTVEYGYWLEVIQNGRFAIIMPTLEQFGPRIMGEVAAKVRTARRGRN